MAGQVHDYPLLINLVEKTILQDFFATVAQVARSMVQGDKYRVILMGVRPNPLIASDPAHPWEYVALSSTLKVGIGNPTAVPELGTFTLTFGANTTAALDYGATAAQVETALNAIASVISAGGVTVTGENGGPWRVVFNNVGARDPFTGNGDALYPTSAVSVFNVRTGTGALVAIQTIALEAQPAALCDTFVSLPAAAATVETLQNGATDVPDVQRVTLDPQPYGGTFTLNFNGKKTTAIPWDATAEELTDILEALENIGEPATEDDPPNVVVTGASPRWVISFQGTKTGDQPQMTADASGLLVPIGKVGTLDLATEGILNALGAEEQVTLTLEVEDSSIPRTILHTDIAIINDLIPTSPGAPRGNPSYLTEDETRQRYLPGLACDALTGGSTNALDAIVTTDLSERAVRMAYVSNQVSLWILQENTGALTEDAALGRVLPDDADSMTNNKIWIRML